MIMNTGRALTQYDNDDDGRASMHRYCNDGGGGNDTNGQSSLRGYWSIER